MITYNQLSKMVESMQHAQKIKNPSAKAKHVCKWCESDIATSEAVECDRCSQIRSVVEFAPKDVLSKIIETIAKEHPAQ